MTIPPRTENKLTLVTASDHVIDADWYHCCSCGRADCETATHDWGMGISVGAPRLFRVAEEMAGHYLSVGTMLRAEELNCQRSPYDETTYEFFWIFRALDGLWAGSLYCAFGMADHEWERSAYPQFLESVEQPPVS